MKVISIVEWAMYVWLKKSNKRAGTVPVNFFICWGDKASMRPAQEQTIAIPDGSLNSVKERECKLRAVVTRPDEEC